MAWAAFSRSASGSTMGGTERTVFGQLFTQLHHIPPKSLRNAERAWHVTMVGFFADDYGGPYRESLADVCAEWKSPVLPLFTRCPNGRAGLGRGKTPGWRRRPRRRSGVR